jgi:ABC-type sugar transport system permease subunit
VARRSRIGRWHKGKLFILWTWTAVVMALFVLLALAIPRNSGPAAALVGFALFLLALAAPIAMSVVTWIWLGAHEEDAGS